MTDEKEFAELVESFLKASGMPPTRFGIEALGDPSFVTDLREKKRNFTLRLVERVKRFIEINKHLPKGLKNG